MPFLCHQSLPGMIPRGLKGSDFSFRENTGVVSINRHKKPLLFEFNISVLSVASVVNRF